MKQRLSLLEPAWTGLQRLRGLTSGKRPLKRVIQRLRRLAGSKRRQSLARQESAIMGRTAGLEDIASFISAHPWIMKAPLVLVSQIERSGGTLLSQLFDDHPAIAAHPHELKIGYPATEDWTTVEPEMSPGDAFRLLFESTVVKRMQLGYTKGARNVVRHRFLFAPYVQQRVFMALWNADPPASRRGVLDHYFSSYFNAWLNYNVTNHNGTLDGKRWITAFAPRLAQKAASVAGFFASYPDGRLIQIIRDPGTWYASAKNQPRWAKVDASLDLLASAWRASAEAILRNKAAHGDGVIILRFEDLVGNTEQTMQKLACMLGIDYAPILAEPTFNGLPIRANSSYSVEQSGVIRAPLARQAMLSDSESHIIEACSRSLYEEVASRGA